MCELLAQSLLAWKFAGGVHRSGDGSILVVGSAKNGNDRKICIASAPPDVPFRWMVTVDGRKRGAISLVAVLRQIRAALDPGYAKNKVRVAVTPLVPS
ncbi:MAG: hypothetical protein QOI40_4461 [Alphaproteobacteria bacterium]|nr:hypothetical protein [Alphaproteobacteria bacterium]